MMSKIDHFVYTLVLNADLLFFVELEKDIESTIQEIFSNSEKLDAKLIKEPAHRRQNSKL